MTSATSRPTDQQHGRQVPGGGARALLNWDIGATMAAVEGESGMKGGSHVFPTLAARAVAWLWLNPLKGRGV